MLSTVSGDRIWLCTQPTDMRCSFDGLSARVRRHLGEDPTSGQWFVFVNRRRTMVKILAFDVGGYWVWSKRLEQGQFGVGGVGEGAKRELNRTALLALLEGVDINIVRQRKRYRWTSSAVRERIESGGVRHDGELEVAGARGCTA